MTEVPPQDAVPPARRAKPYIYTDAEITALLAAALSLPPANALRRWTYHCLFGLIAVAGLRHSEALDLRRDDVDLDQGILTIRETKFGKSRLVPLHATTVAVLSDYAARRDAHLVAPISLSPSRAADCCTNTCTAVERHASRLRHHGVAPLATIDR
nr:tyrosine-type recombinase/integrase [Mesorhizobium sp.]